MEAQKETSLSYLLLFEASSCLNNAKFSKFFFFFHFEAKIKGTEWKDFFFVRDLFSAETKLQTFVREKRSSKRKCFWQFGDTSANAGFRFPLMTRNEIWDFFQWLLLLVINSTSLHFCRSLLFSSEIFFSSVIRF